MCALLIAVQGINTLVINVTFLSNSSVLGNGTHNMTGPPANETYSSPEIDFYFFMWGNATHDSRPSAVVQFESCKYESRWWFFESSRSTARNFACWNSSLQCRPACKQPVSAHQGPKFGLSLLNKHQPQCAYIRICSPACLNVRQPSMMYLMLCVGFGVPHISLLTTSLAARLPCSRH